MRYILLTYQNAEACNDLSKEESDDFMHAAGEIVKELSASGEWGGGEGLAGAWQAGSTHVRDGVVTVSDGSFLEVKEARAGYCVVDVATPDGAGESAVRWPVTQRWGMEIGTLMHGGGEEG
jgi:hypothetical protein